MELDSAYRVLAMILLFIGIILALFGRAIWEKLLSSLGSMIGGILGFAVGTQIFDVLTAPGLLYAIALAIVCAIIIGFIFYKLMKLGLAIVAGLLVAAAIYSQPGDNMIYAMIAFSAVTLIAYVFIDHLVVAITALIGSILSAAAVHYLYKDNMYTILAFVGLLILGGLIQHFMLEDHDCIRNRD